MLTGFGSAVLLPACGVGGSENYLRGVQVTDSAGQVTFGSIFPAACSGRYPHIHFEVYRNADTATQGSNSLLTSQMCLPRDIGSAGYTGSITVGLAL